jgi:hypothetical protein
MNWALCLVFFLTLLVLIVIKRNEEFRGRLRFRGGSGGTGEPGIFFHILMAICIAVCLIYRNFSSGIILLIMWILVGITKYLTKKNVAGQSDLLK